MASTKRKYLVGLDSGKLGGGLFYILAESFAQVEEQFPELILFEEEPPWFAGELKAKTQEKLTIDIDDESNELLRAITKGRQSRAQQDQEMRERNLRSK